MAKVLNRALKIVGERKYIEGNMFNVIEFDMDNNILRARYAGVPPDSLSGFGAAATVYDSTNGDLYRNDGNSTASSFAKIADGAQGDTGVTGATGAQGDTGVSG